MRNPHPWLARFAHLGMASALAAGLAGVTATLLAERPGSSWYGAHVVQKWQRVDSAGSALVTARNQLDGLAVAAVGPAGWLLAAGLLRLAATDRLSAPALSVRKQRAARGVMAVGMVLAGLGVASGVAWWVNPGWDNQRGSDPSRVDRRVHAGWTREYALPVQFDRVPNQPRIRHWGAHVAQDNPVLLAVLLAHTEGFSLFAAVREAGLSFFLCGTAYCLSRRSEDDA